MLGVLLFLFIMKITQIVFLLIIHHILDSHLFYEIMYYYIFFITTNISILSDFT